MKKMLLSFLIVIVFLMFNLKSFGYTTYMVGPNFVKGIIKYPFQPHSIKHEKAKETIDKYFNGKPYKVIIAEPYGYNESIIYFAVEEYMPEKYYNAIKRGIVVKENGEIDTYMDTEKGVYHEKWNVVDFEEMGLKKKEVKSLILYSYDNRCYWISLLDQEDNNINDNELYPASIWLFALYFAEIFEENHYIGSQYYEGVTKAQLIDEQRKSIENYRKAKAQGKAVKSAAVKTEFERLKKAGLVQEK